MNADDQSRRQHLLDCARFYRSLGFFAEQAALPDESLADVLDRTWRDAWERDFDSRTVMDELLLAHLDKDRVWWEDAFEWLGDVETMYADALQGWGRISRGAFRPTDVSESWETPDGPVTVDVTIGGQRFRFHPEAAGETLDLNLLGPINALIAPSGMRFETVDMTDQTSYLVVLSAAEKEILRKRGWPFEDWIPTSDLPSPIGTEPHRPVEPKRKRWFGRK